MGSTRIRHYVAGLGTAALLLAGSACPAQQMAMMASPSMINVGHGAARPLLVLGFMGGRVKADNLVHKEAVIARDLQQQDGSRVKVFTFANHVGGRPLAEVLRYVDTDGDGKLSPAEKAAARIVIYGHSWGASETVHLADQLAALGVPVLLTIQVDSVQKFGENDELIPANVREAINFYQTEGLLHGRAAIRAVDPAHTVILGNRQLSYSKTPVDCGQFPWFARTFMGPHIEIENDPAVWSEVEAMIQARVEPPAAAR
jgi:hypothetical protein